MAFRTSIFYRLQLKIIKIYNLIWTSVHVLKCKFKGHDLDRDTLPGFRTFTFCKRRGCKFGHIKQSYSDEIK